MVVIILRRPLALSKANCCPRGSGTVYIYERTTVGGGRIGKMSCAHTHTHTNRCTYPPACKTGTSTHPHTRTHSQIHTPVHSRWMASLIMVEMKKWISGVHPLFRQLWPKTPQRSESYWSLEMNNQRGTRGEQHTEATYTSIGLVFTQAAHYNWSETVYLFKEDEIVSYSSLKFSPLNCSRLRFW